MASISLILATYQRDNYLPAVLDDLLNQKNISYEIIVVDQTKSRTQETKRIIDVYIGSPRIRWFNQDTPSPNKARNLGAKNASSDILVFIDDDVIINDPLFLKKHYDHYADPGIWAVCGSELAEEQALEYCSWVDRLDTPIEQALYFPRWHSKSMNAVVCSTCNFSIQKKRFISLLGLDENFKGNGYCDDTDLGVRLSKAGGVILYDPCVSLIHRFAVTGGCTITGKSTYPGWQQYVSPFIFAFRHLKGIQQLRFILNNALRKSLLLKTNFLSIWRWPRVLTDTILAIFKAIKLAASPVESIFSEEQTSFNRVWMCNVLLSHSGKQHAYKQALSLQRIGRLSRFITSAYYDPEKFLDRIFSKFRCIDTILRKRNEPGLKHVLRYPLFEIPEIILRRVSKNAKANSLAVCIRDDLFDRFVANTKISKCKIFWGFQGSCLKSIQSARKKNIKVVVEFPTAHITAAQKILGEECKRSPEWADSISNYYYPDWYLKRLKAEPFDADICVVASKFSRSTLVDAGVDERKIKILPLGADIQKFQYKPRATNGPFEILFVGGVGQRKGIKYLLDAYEKIKTKNTKLKVIGPLSGSGAAFFKRKHLYSYLGLLTQEEILAHMHESHVLVLPSLFEGFGLVIPEAMASGMPVIASPNSAGPDIVREGVDGFVINPLDVNMLTEKLSWLASNRDKINEMGANASERAKEYSWEKHSERLSALLESIEAR